MMNVRSKYNYFIVVCGFFLYFQHTVKNLGAYRSHSGGEIVIFIGKNANKDDDFPRQSDLCTLLEKSHTDK